MSEEQEARAKVLSARLEIEWPRSMVYNAKRYVRSAAPAVDLPGTLAHLRSLDFASPDVQGDAARLLDRCGYAPSVEPETGHARRAARWASEHIGADILESLAAIQRAAVAIEREKAEQSAQGYKRIARGAKGRVPSVRDMETAIVTYLKRQRRDVPQKENSGTYLSELFGALADAAREAGEPLERVLQRIAPGPLRPELTKAVPASPGEVLRHLLNVCTASGRIDTLVRFDGDGQPVVRIAPRDAVCALLLRTHEAAALREESWARCAWCGKAFARKRRDQKACGDTCKNSLKKQRQRARKRAHDETKERRAQHHAEKSQG